MVCHFRVRIHEINQIALRCVHQLPGHAARSGVGDPHYRGTRVVQDADRCALARHSGIYGERGNRVQANFFGVDGKLVLSQKIGFASETVRYD